MQKVILCSQCEKDVGDIEAAASEVGGGLIIKRGLANKNTTCAFCEMDILRGDDCYAATYLEGVVGESYEKWEGEFLQNPTIVHKDDAPIKEERPEPIKPPSGVGSITKKLGLIYEDGTIEYILPLDRGDELPLVGRVVAHPADSGSFLVLNSDRIITDVGGRLYRYPCNKKVTSFVLQCEN